MIGVRNWVAVLTDAPVGWPRLRGRARVPPPDVPQRLRRHPETEDPADFVGQRPACSSRFVAAVFTGIHTGRVGVAVEVRTRPVTVVYAVGRIRVVGLFGDLPEQLPNLTPNGPGDDRVRVHARGRDTGHASHTLAEPVEDYLILVWPAPAAPETIHKHSDDYGAMLRGRDNPRPDPAITEA